jgi:hypothetical protein
MRTVAAGLLAAFAAAGVAGAEELGPLEAMSITLGDVSGVAYYTVSEDGYEVVATLAAGESGMPMRFVATLKEGQVILLSVPGTADEAPAELQLARSGHRLVVSDPRAVMN